MTTDEYLALETASAAAHELIAGSVVAMATASKAHARIVQNINRAVGPVAIARGCDHFAEDAKVRSPIDGDCTIPDIVISCDARDIEDDGAELILRYPCFVAEVISRSTALRDTVDKVRIYDSIPSIEQYLLVDSRRQALGLYERGQDGRFCDGRVVESVALRCLGDLVLGRETIYFRSMTPRNIRQIPLLREDT